MAFNISGRGGDDAAGIGSVSIIGEQKSKLKAQTETHF